MPASLEQYQRIIDKLIMQGSEAIILGCTEISLLVSPDDARVRLFDTTQLHAQSAAERALL